MGNDGSAKQKGGMAMALRGGRGEVGFWHRGGGGWGGWERGEMGEWLVWRGVGGGVEKGFWETRGTAGRRRRRLDSDSGAVDRWRFRGSGRVRRWGTVAAVAGAIAACRACDASTLLGLAWYLARSEYSESASASARRVESESGAVVLTRGGVRVWEGGGFSGAARGIVGGGFDELR